MLNPSSNVFFKIQSGVSLPDIGTPPTIAGFPLGFVLGRSVAAGSTVLDPFVAFRFRIFGAVGAGESELTSDIWTITFGINIYSPVLF